MHCVRFDGTFRGFLTCVFEVYEYKLNEPNICSPHDKALEAFAAEHRVVTDERKAERVWNGLKERISQQAMMQVYRAFLSGNKGMFNVLLKYIQDVFANPRSIEYDFGNDAVRIVHETSRKVYREKHRMEAFVRFQLTEDNLYYSIIEPDYDVLPLIASHFENRYADQDWLIYDVRRKYGLSYSKGSLNVVGIQFAEAVNEGKDVSKIYAKDEELYQRLWQTYFSSVNIDARRNMKLHIQHMPVRYWKFLPEKSRPLVI
jgi:probable DNA metabolism protein